jgi:hypothetical protein
MNQSTHLITKKYSGLDQNVWGAMSLLLLLSLALLSFLLIHKERCESFRIIVHGDAIENARTYRAGDEIHFSTSLTQPKEISWNFGDNSAEERGIASPHVFEQGGTYFITAVVNDQCTETISIHVKNTANHTEATTAATKDLIAGPEYVELGVAANFTAMSNATALEWSIVNAPGYPKQFSKTATYTFQKEGVFVIRLKAATVSRTKEIHVSSFTAKSPAAGYQEGSTDNLLRKAAAGKDIALPDESSPVSLMERPAGKAIPDERKNNLIADQQFVYLLNAATRDKQDLQSFDEFLCSGSKTKVLANNEWTSFDAFFEKIHANKKYEIKFVQADRDAAGCVQKLTIRYKKRGVLGL